MLIRNALCALTVALFLLVAHCVALGQVSADIYTGFSPSGFGTPFTGFVGTVTSNEVRFFSHGWWHPFGLAAFGAHITGFLEAPQSGTYTFGLVTDDGSGFYLNGVLNVDAGGYGQRVAVGPPTTMTAGVTVPFYIDFWEDGQDGSGVDLNLQDPKTGNLYEVPLSWYVTPEPSAIAGLVSALLLAAAAARRRLR